MAERLKNYSKILWIALVASSVGLVAGAVLVFFH